MPMLPFQPPTTATGDMHTFKKFLYSKHVGVKGHDLTKFVAKKIDIFFENEQVFVTVQVFIYIVSVQLGEEKHSAPVIFRKSSS